MAGVDQALRTLYARVGARVVVVCIATGIAIQGTTGLLTAAGAARYLRLSMGDFFVLVAMATPVNLIAGLAALYVSRDLFRRGLSWAGTGRRADRAVAVWDAGVRGPYLVARRCVLFTGIGLLPVAAAITVVFDQPVYTVIPLFIGGAAAILAAGLLIAFGAELLLRPMLDDIASMLPADFEPPVRVWRLRTKALAPLPVVTFFATVAVGAFTDLDTTPAARFTIATGIAIVGVAASGMVFLVLMRSTLDPLGDLLDATHRVREGDLTTRVPVVTADDLGQLSSSFNKMLDGLVEREALRERNTELVDDLRASRARIVAASDAERRRIERNLHDGAQQQLIALAMRLRALEEQIDDDADKRAVGAAGERVRQVMNELRELARGLHPSILTTDGLYPALEQLAERASQPVTVDAPRERYPEAIESAAYFVACEALANTAKYAQATYASVVVERRAGRLVIEITDDGVGGAQPTNGSGLTGLVDRIAALDGSLAIDSPPGRGTKVTANLPIA